MARIKNLIRFRISKYLHNFKNYQNKYFTEFRFDVIFMRFRAVPFRTRWDINHPFAHHICVIDTPIAVKTTPLLVWQLSRFLSYISIPIYQQVNTRTEFLTRGHKNLLLEKILIRLSHNTHYRRSSWITLDSARLPKNSHQLVSFQAGCPYRYHVSIIWALNSPLLNH